MKIMAWNCRGLGNAPAVRELLRCQKAEDADVLFLSETKMDEGRLMSFKQKLGLGNLVVVDCEEKGGGLQCFGGVESMWFCEQNQRIT
jgi:exonuclease III